MFFDVLFTGTAIRVHPVRKAVAAITVVKSHYRSNRNDQRVSRDHWVECSKEIKLQGRLYPEKWCQIKILAAMKLLVRGNNLVQLA